MIPPGLILHKNVHDFVLNDFLIIVKFKLKINFDYFFNVYNNQ